MVVWVYAGGGETELLGFVPFLQNHLSGAFERRLPKDSRRVPRADTPVTEKTSMGLTGKGLSDRIKKEIETYWDGAAQAILILDDIDQEPPEACHQLHYENVRRVLKAKGVGDDNFPLVIALAVPEIESWLLADPENTFKKGVRLLLRSATTFFGRVQFRQRPARKFSHDR